MSVETNEPKEGTWEEVLMKMRRLTYNQPDITFSIVLTLLRKLEEKNILSPGEAEAIIKEGVALWQ